MQECKDLLEQAQNTAKAVIDKFGALSRTLVLAESCTSGLVSSLLAEVPGASKTFWGCFVCYTKEAKAAMLGLDINELDKKGLVSKDTAKAMAEGALQKSGAQAAASVTGLAGPDGDGSGLPPGTVWVASAVRGGEPLAKEFHFTGVRNEIRIRAAIAVLDALNSLF